MDINYERRCLITGAGAIENAWKPIIRVLEPDYKFVFDIDSSNFFLALLVYQLRSVALHENQPCKKHFELILRDYHLIKSELCRSLVFAEKHKEIFVRKEFYFFLSRVFRRGLGVIISVISFCLNQSALYP